MTIQLFLRELRGVWPGAGPPLDPRAEYAARHLGLITPGSPGLPALTRLAAEAGTDPRDVESGLVRLTLAHHRRRTPVRKTRITGAIVRAEEIAGDVTDRPAVIVDDMISTGATIEAAAQVVLAHGGTCSTVAATHGLLVGGPGRRLRQLPIRRVVTTDTLPQGHTPSLGLHVESVAPLLADAISRLHHDQPLAGLRAPT